MAIDLKMEQGELCIDEDLVLSTDLETLKQDIMSVLTTEVGMLFYDENYGMSILNFIQSGLYASIEMMIQSKILACLKNDDRVDDNAAKVELQQIEQSLLVKITCETIDAQTLNLELVME